MRPSLRQLEAFVSVARLGTFARAASELALSQPALSQSISQLEKGLGTLLIQRTTRSAFLTPDGEFLLPAAERILHELDATLRDLKESATTRRSKVAVGAMPSLAVGFMPHVMKRFSASARQIQLILHDAQSENLYRGVESGQLDLAVSSRLADRPGLQFTSLMHDRFHLVLRRDHPLASRRAVRWRELEALPVIGFAGGTGTRAALMMELAKAEIVFRPIMELSMSTTILGMVEAGIGVAPLTFFALPPADHPQLMSLRLERPVISREIGIVTSTQRPLTAVAASLIKAIRSYAGEVAEVSS